MLPTYTESTHVILPKFSRGFLAGMSIHISPTLWIWHRVESMGHISFLKVNKDMTHHNWL
jgi:hypothetical protein